MTLITQVTQTRLRLVRWVGSVVGPDWLIDPSQTDYHRSGGGAQRRFMDAGRWRQMIGCGAPYGRKTFVAG